MTQFSDASRTVSIRPAQDADFDAVAAIYRPYVTDTAITFETEPPAACEMRRRWNSVTAAGAPYLVAERFGVVVGYAYAHPFAQRAAYRWTVENTIYVSDSVQRQGVGRQLLSSLIQASAEAGFRQMIALIAAGQSEGSLRLHEAMGFLTAGHLRAVGYKFDSWYDVVYMQKVLGQGDTTHPR